MIFHPSFPHSAGSVANVWMAEPSLTVQVNWGTTCVVTMVLQAPEFSEHLEQSSLAVGGSRVARVSTWILRLGGGRGQVCPHVGEGLLKKMEEGNCHLRGCEA